MKKSIAFLAGCLLVSVLLNVWVYGKQQGKEKELTQLKEKEVQVTKEKQAVEQQLEQRTQELTNERKKQTHQTQKTVTKTAKSLFSTAFDYQSDKASDSIKKRKEKATQWANEEVVNQLFPKDADQAKPSVQTVSTLEQTPHVYLQEVEKATDPQPALVTVSYSVTIAGSDKQTGSFLYRVVFDPQSQTFTQLRNLGAINENN
ncbi:hypothetical protein D929_00824 [Enterococcus faecalis 02-MB-P-10]|uniref:hypothetical protein n=1 Tax=Enterococcus faecalis TaxID=1351 RepID=UPI000353AFC9|nr:hypothetical protein [Enterococcus faecalis]EPH75341.1 hypothetical protein D929_00824 [Enterococcus faecalis 02-MB-P-10]